MSSLPVSSVKLFRAKLIRQRTSLERNARQSARPVESLKLLLETSRSVMQILSSMATQMSVPCSSCKQFIDRLRVMRERQSFKTRKIGSQFGPKKQCARSRLLRRSDLRSNARQLTAFGVKWEPRSESDLRFFIVSSDMMILEKGSIGVCAQRT